MRVTPQQTAEYFQRGFMAADGLWFMKTEEVHGFDEALELDRRVWEVVPKIQARLVKEWCGKGGGTDALAECLTAKYGVEGHVAIVTETEAGVEVAVRVCPWYEKLVKSGRTALAARIGPVICPTELAAWAREFGLSGEVRMESSICEGTGGCKFVIAGDRASNPTAPRSQP